MTEPSTSGPSSSGPSSSGPSSSGPEVLAAGALCWRRGARELELLMVHRPRYDDWSFPKGKLDDDELAAVCAVRELAEETGVVVRLGRPLPEVTYTDQNGAPKRVFYWAAVPMFYGTPTAKAGEVDEVEWVALSRVADRLTAAGDKAPLDALAVLAAAGELDTVPVLVVRHATARPRDAWARADADRPLVDAGRRQAAALVSLLGCWQPENVISSPWRRCLQTLAPYVERTGVRVRTKGGLSERGFRRSPGKAAKHLTALVERRRPAALCTHRPVLDGVLRALGRLTTPATRTAIPTEDPFLAPGEVLIAHVRRSGPGRPVVAIERQRLHPPDSER